MLYHKLSLSCRESQKIINNNYCVITVVGTRNKDMETIKYTPDTIFRKLTKKQKLELPEFSPIEDIEITKLIIIPINKKLGGYHAGSFFAFTENKGWWRLMSYDCWQIHTEIDNPATPRYMILRGDFEYGGINIFTFVDEFHKAYISYGGTITIKKIIK